MGALRLQAALAAAAAATLVACSGDSNPTQPACMEALTSSTANDTSMPMSWRERLAWEIEHRDPDEMFYLGIEPASESVMAEVEAGGGRLLYKFRTISLAVYEVPVRAFPGLLQMAEITHLFFDVEGSFHGCMTSEGMSHSSGAATKR